MAKKKKGLGASFRQQVNNIPVVQQQAPRTISTNVSTGGGGLASSVKTATQKAEEERSTRMRQGLSSVVRASFNNRRLQPSNNSTNTVKKGLYQNLRNQLAPVKETANYTRSQQNKFLTTDLQRKGMYTPASQLMAGKTNVGVEQGKALRAGMPSGYLTESWRTKPIFTPENWRVQQRDNLIGTPVTKENAFDLRADANKIDRSHSQAELDARQRYGYSKDFEDYMRNRVENSGKIDRFDPSNGRMTTPLPPSMNQLMQNQSTTYMAGKAIADRMRLSDLKAGALDSASAQEIEDVAKNAYGFTPDDELQAKLEAQRSTLGYGTGMAAGQMAQYALTRGALTGLGVVGKGAKATETAAQALQREIAIDQAASLPLNIIDAMKEDNLDGMIKRFGMNQALDLAFGALTEVPSIAKSKWFKNAQAKHIAAKEAAEAGDNVTANALEQSAKRDFDSATTKELDEARDSIVAKIGEQRRIINDEQVNAIQNAEGTIGEFPSTDYAYRIGGNRANYDNMRDDMLGAIESQEAIGAGSVPNDIGMRAEVRPYEPTAVPKTGVDKVLADYNMSADELIARIQDPNFEDVQMLEDIADDLFTVGQRRSMQIDAERLYSDAVKEFSNNPELDAYAPRQAYMDVLTNNIVDELRRSQTTNAALPIERNQVKGILGNENKTVEKQAAPEYNASGGVDNGTEPSTRSDAERTVGKVQEQPNGNTDAEISGRRPEERPADNSGNNRRLLLNDKQEKLFNDNNVARTGVRESDSPSFISSITENSNSQKYGACVDIPSEKHLKETGAKLYSTADGAGTVAVTKDGDIIALSKKRGAAEGTTDELLLTAIAKGGKKMDAFGADLANLYSRYGFEPVGRVEFNPAIYADEPEKLAVFKQLAVDGKEGPDVYVFKHNGDSLETVLKKNRNGEYKSWSQDELDKLPVFEDSVDGAGKEVYGYDKALEYRDGLLKQQEPPKDSLGRDIFDGQPRYKPSGAGRDEKYWNKVVKKYEKHSTTWLNNEKLSLPTKVVNNKMGKEEAIERSKLIESLIDEKARFRHGTLKEVDGEKISQAYDTLSHSEKAERIRDELQRTFVEDGTGRKQGMHPKQAAEEAVARVESDPEAVKLKLREATKTASKGKFPAKYDNSQEYYADVLAYLNHNDSVMEQLEEQGLKNSSQYESLKEDAVEIMNGVMAYRSSEGYGAIQYNMLCRSSGEMRVAVVQKAIDDINTQFEKQLEKAAKKEGRKLTEADKIRIQLTDDAIKKLKSVNPDSPLEMSKAMHEISEEIWNQVPASFKEEADAIRMTSMLLNPKTHIRNFIGNAFMIPARIMKDILGAPLEKAATKIKFRGESILNPDDATKAIAFRHSKKDKPYFDAAKQVWEEWKEYVRGDMKYFDNVTPTASRLLGSRPVGGGKVFTAGRENPAAWRKVADKIINFNGRLLEASDALFLKYHFTDSFAQVCKARNLDPTKLTNQELQEVIAAATGEAQRATFRDVSEAAKLINGLKASRPNDALIKKGVAWGTSTVMPFVNTPINILRRSWDYSPAGLLHGCAEITQGVAKGSSKEVKKGIDRMCSGLTGTGICIVGFLLGRDGGLTAKLSDGSEGYYEQDQGFQEYSVNVGGKDGIQLPFLKLENEDGVSVSLSSFAPLVIPLFTGVEVANWWGDDKELDWSAIGRAVDTFGRIFDPTMDMSVMQGPMSVLKAVQDADSLKTAPVDVGLNIAINHYMQYIPTAFGQAARIADPVRRDLSSTKSSYFDKQLEKAKLKFQSKIPSTILTDNALYNVSSTGIQPYKDTWGREQVTFGDSPVKRFFYETLSPSYIREKNITELDEEITRLNKAATQEEKIIPTKFFGNEVSFNGGKIGVDRKDMTVYNEFRGKSAYAAASKLIDTDGYKTASDSEKRKMLDEVFKEANTEGKQNMLLSKGYSAKKVYTDGFEGGKLENADNAFNAGVEPKDYYKLMTDKSVDLDGNGSKTQYEVYTYLQNSDLTEAQKAAIWNSYNKGWKNNPYAGGTIPTADGSGSKSSSGGSKRGRSGRRSSGGGSSKAKARTKTASEKRFAALQTGKAPTNAKGIEALSSGAKGLTKAQKKALIKMMQKKLDV